MHRVTEPTIKRHIQEEVAGHLGREPFTIAACPVIGDGKGQHIIFGEEGEAFLIVHSEPHNGVTRIVGHKAERWFRGDLVSEVEGAA